MQSDVSIAFCGTSLSWYNYYQPPLIARLQAATGKFIREFDYGYNGSNSNGTDGGLSRIGQVVADHPDFALIEYSMDDCAFLTRAQAIANHVAMLDALKTVMPASRLFLMTMNDS